MATVTERRICWPEFDATCLEGGCMYCNGFKFRKISTIRRAAEKMGITHNRGNGRVRDPMEAFNYGDQNRWNNADSR